MFHFGVSVKGFQRRILHLLVEIREMLKRTHDSDVTTVLQATTMEELFDETLTDKQTRISVVNTK